MRDNGFYNIQSKPIAVSNFGFNIISAEQFCKYLFLLCFWNSIAAVAYAYRKLFFAPLRGARQALRENLMNYQRMYFTAFEIRF